jgi:hypothetical protein
VRVVYLDQNKWIDLARAAKYPAEHPDLHRLLKVVGREVRDGRLALPLAAANIYETQKINNEERRRDLASLQAVLSKGLVFRGRHKRLEIEISDVLRGGNGLPALVREEHWFLSEMFFEAFTEWNDPRLGSMISESVIAKVRSDPSRELYKYLLETPDDVRQPSVRMFSEGIERLRQEIEERRLRHKGERRDVRRRIQSALLMINEIDLILEIARRAGLPWRSVSDMGSENARKIVEDVATYYVEREIALRLEAQTRPITENDFRDMQTFCTVLPYADQVIAENQFSSLAKQAGLDRKYNTQLTTAVEALGENLCAK